jgi:hypothetical protein
MKHIVYIIALLLTVSCNGQTAINGSTIINQPSTTHPQKNDTVQYVGPNYKMVYDSLSKLLWLKSGTLQAINKYVKALGKNKASAQKVTALLNSTTAGKYIPAKDTGCRQCAHIELQRYWKHKKDSIYGKLFVARFKIEKVKYYHAICIRKPKQEKYLKGWIIRALE